MEYLGLYDEQGNYTKERIERSRKMEVPKGRYFRIVIVFIQNSYGEFLIQKVSKEKGNEYATTGGHVQVGVSSLNTVKQEALEELGLSLSDDEIVLFETVKYPKAFQDCYYVKKDIDINKLNIQPEEVEFVEWMNPEKISILIQNDIFRKGNIGPYKDLINLIETKKGFEYTLYKIGKIPRGRNSK